MKKLSTENQELLNEIYPDGYEVQEDEKHTYHVLFIKIFITKGRNNRLVPMVQQINIRDWGIMKGQLDKGWTLAAITGYDELAIIYDPTEKVVDKPIEKKAAKAKPGPKPKAEPANK